MPPRRRRCQARAAHPGTRRSASGPPARTGPHPPACAPAAAQASGSARRPRAAAASCSRLLALHVRGRASPVWANGPRQPRASQRRTPACAGVERIRDDRSAQRRQTLNDLFRTVRQMQTRDFLVGAPPAGAQEGTLRGRRTCPAKARARAGAARAPVTRRLLVERRRGAAGALRLQRRQLLGHRAARRQGPGARRSASPASAMPAPACNGSGRTERG